MLRFGRYVRLTEERLARAESFFTRHGGKIVMWPGSLRASPRPTASSPGSPRMHWLRFLAFNALGAAPARATWTSVGYLAVAQSKHLPGEVTSISGALPNRALTQLLEDLRYAHTHLVHESVACGVRGTGRSVLVAGRARRESIGWHGGWCALAAGGVRW